MKDDRDEYMGKVLLGIPDLRKDISYSRSHMHLLQILEQMKTCVQ